MRKVDLREWEPEGVRGNLYFWLGNYWQDKSQYYVTNVGGLSSSNTFIARFFNGKVVIILPLNGQGTRQNYREISNWEKLKANSYREGDHILFSGYGVCMAGLKIWFCQDMQPVKPTMQRSGDRVPGYFFRKRYMR